jgi:hypothetical protein
MAQYQFSPAEDRSQKSRAKKILIVFFDVAGIIHSAFVPEGTTVESLLFWTTE